MNQLRETLLRDGACVIPSLLNPPLLSALDQCVAEQLARVTFTPGELAATHPFHYNFLIHRILIGWPPALQALRDLGFPDARWWGGAVIPKPVGEPPRSWHQDWWAWQYPESQSETPPQLGLMYYLADTDERSGALRIMPGSHRKEMPLHSTYLNVDGAALNSLPGEKTIAARRGDLVLLDARTLHSTHAHQEGELRTCLTLWYAAEWQALSSPVQRYMWDSQPEAWRHLGEGLAPEHPGSHVSPARQNYFPAWCPEHQKHEERACL